LTGSVAYAKNIDIFRFVDLFEKRPMTANAAFAKPASTTATEAAVRKLKRDIMSGALAPDSQLKMRELKERYGIGASPMREALAQLAAEGFVHQRAQKGFRVPPVSLDELIDITRTRQFVEAEAMKLAIEHATPAWEEEIVASFHVLERAIIQTKAGDKDRDHFEERHHRFHRALISSCPLESMRNFCDELYVRKTRYRRMLGSYGFSSKEVIAEHRLLMDAVLARNITRAKDAIRQHIGITADVIAEVLRSKQSRELAPKPRKRRKTRATRR
jgi:GntR family transcriptional regulator, carbon starvation induced regulator